MFRTSCFESTEFQDSISPDTDFVGDGYKRAFRLPNYGVLG